MHIIYLIVEQLIDLHYNYLSVNMDPEVVVQLMISQQLLSEDVVLTAQSCYHKNCLILEKVGLMDTKKFVLFCELLKQDDSGRKIGEMLLTGKHPKLCKVYLILKCAFKCKQLFILSLSVFLSVHARKWDCSIKLLYYSSVTRQCLNTS